jgi:hypothetical protein
MMTLRSSAVLTIVISARHNKEAINTWPWMPALLVQTAWYAHRLGEQVITDNLSMWCPNQSTADGLSSQKQQHTMLLVGSKQAETAGHYMQLNTSAQYQSYPASTRPMSYPQLPWDQMDKSHIALNTANICTTSVNSSQAHATCATPR